MFFPAFTEGAVMIVVISTRVLLITVGSSFLLGGHTATVSEYPFAFFQLANVYLRG